jgi:hypothetical protein
VKSRTVQASAAALGDKACIYCGASLEGLTAHDRCPDCGKPAVDSLLQNYLRDADHEWLRAILRGITFTTVAHIGLVVGWLLWLVATFLNPREFDASIFRTYVFLLSWVLFAIGTWYLTAPEPAESLVARRRTLPWLIRLTAIGCAACAVVPLIHHPAVLQWHVGVNVARMVLAVLANTLPLLEVRRYIDRTPRREVGRALMGGVWASLVLCLIAAAVSFLVVSNTPIEIRQWVIAGELLLWLIPHAIAIYLLTLSGAGIRRTVGYWT